MLHSKTRWSLRPPDPARAERLAKALGIRPLLASLLAARGHTEEEAAFFLSEEPTFHDPLLLKGMAEAAVRIRSAIDAGERLLIYGDYDADGVSAVSLLVRLFRMLDAAFDVRIPHRVQDGYGLHTHYLEQAKEDGVSLVITVDTGITAIEQAQAARALGLDLIVTDHHEPHETLPDALSVINPKQDDCEYPFRGLAGVGVAFKLAQALLGRVPVELAPYAALGTIADLMPLVGENRSIAKLGLQRLREAPPPGFAALFDVAGARRPEVSAYTIGFAIAPRINASGRLESADDAVRLLTTDDALEAEAIALRLDALNKERQRMVEEAAREAMDLVEQGGGAGDAIVVASARWNPGIIGIVASRLVEAYYRPTVVVAIDTETGTGKGSARSIPGFDLFAALQSCQLMFDHFGGHESAAGLSVAASRLDAFAEAFRKEAAVRLTEELKAPVTLADADVSPEDVTLEAIEELEKLAPFGMAHPAPMFAIRRASVADMAVIGKDKRHAKFRLNAGKGTLDAVGFGFGEAVRRIAPGSLLSLVGELSVNEWNNRRMPQVIVKDIAVPHVQLFDWRDAAGGAALRERLTAALEGGALPAFLLGPHDEAPPALAPWWSRVPAFRTSADAGAPAPANAAAEGARFDEATDLFFPHCPFPWSEFRLILEQTSSLCRVYALAVGGVDSPDRETLKWAYVRIRQLGEAREEDWLRVLTESGGFGREAARFAIAVFRELGFVQDGESPGTIRAAAEPARRDLAESALFSRAQQLSADRREWAALAGDALRERLLGQADFLNGMMELTIEERTTEAAG